jgi:multiple sugar transport system substrate-binding protein
MSRLRVGRFEIGFVASSLVAFAFGGCFGWSTPTPATSSPSFQGTKITVAVIGGPGILPTIASQRGEWEASRGGVCIVQESPIDSANTGTAHVLVFGGDQLGALVDVAALTVLPEALVQPPRRDGEEAAAKGADSDEPAPDALQFADVIPAFRDQVCKYGNDRMALPIGGTALVLVYSREAFEREANRVAAKAAGIALVPPKTWEELDAVAKFFQGRDWDGDGTTDFGIAAALNADPEGVGNAIFLARAASLGQHRDHYSLLFDSDTMEPRIASPPFREAIDGMRGLKAYGPPGIQEFDAEGARKAFRERDVAMLIDRAERAPSWAEGKVKELGVASLPGSTRVYEPVRKRWETVTSPNRPSYLPHGGGWLVGVSRSAQGRERDAALDFVKYLVNPETSNRLRSDKSFPMLPVRGSQVAQGISDPRSAPGVALKQWSDAVSKTLLAPRAVPGLRIPAATDYLVDLDLGRAAAMRGEPAEKALARVAEAWTERTEKLGKDRQLWHYRRSLNSLVTAPAPPSR